MAAVLRCERLAMKSVIQNDAHRTPRVQLLLGQDSWVTQMDNGIK